MSRGDGFAIADVSTALLDDDKMRDLWRRLGNQADMCEAVISHEAVLLGSWREGKRLTIGQAAPLWLSVRAEIVAALMAVGLIDRTQRLPAKTWTTWFGTAAARRELRREAGAKGGKAPRKPRSSTAQPLLNPTGRQAGPSSPSVNTVRQPRPRGTDGAKRNGGPEKVGTLPPFETMVGGKSA